MKIANYMFKQFLEDGEQIQAVFHRHPFIMFSEISWILVFGFLVPGFVLFLFPNLLLLCGMIMLIGVARIIDCLTRWYYDSLLITSVSLLNVTWKGPFDKTSARLEYNQIEGISYEFHGFSQTVFNYGLLVVQYGDHTKFNLDHAMNPKKIERDIIAYQEKFNTHQDLTDAESLKSLLTNMIRQHVKKNGVQPDNKTIEKTMEKVVQKNTQKSVQRTAQNNLKRTVSKPNQINLTNHPKHK